MLPRPRTDVEHPVGGLHDLRIVFHHDQAVARVAQPVHDADDAVDIPGMQSDGRLVEHEQRVDERGAERRREVDPLHFPARQGSRLTVEIEISQPDLAEVREPRPDLAQQHRGGLLQGRREPKRREELAQAADRHQHQLADTEAGRPDAPEQGVGLQARAATCRAFGVGAVARQEHADVHLVCLGLEPGEEAPHAVPDVLLPRAFALDHPGPFGLGEVLPGRVERNGAFAGEAQEVCLAFGVRFGMPGLDRAICAADRERMNRE